MLSEGTKVLLVGLTLEQGKQKQFQRTFELLSVGESSKGVSY